MQNRGIPTNRSFSDLQIPLNRQIETKESKIVQNKKNIELQSPRLRVPSVLNAQAGQDGQKDVGRFPFDEPYPDTKVRDLVTLTFKNLKYSVQVKNNYMTNYNGSKYSQNEILRDLTGICKPKELTAIMGPSGAGKTTLLNVLSTRTSQAKTNLLTGKCLANGQKYDLEKFSQFAGYVMQNDILYDTLTPREIFEFTAKLRLYGTLEEKIKKVDQLIADLQLERAADTLVGGAFTKGISGGERKRVSIGIEMITDPSLLFLDEPTSGLDSFTAFILISLLKSLTVKGGKTIVFTIHQPSSDIFFMFDNLMLLAKGKFIYQGPAKLAVDYFGKIGYQCPEYSNPADYLMQIGHSDKDDDAKFLRMYDEYDEVIAPRVEKEVAGVSISELTLAEKTNGFLFSAFLISKRSFLNLVRNSTLGIGRFVQTLFICFLLSSIYFHISDNSNQDRLVLNINGSLFFFSITVFITSCFPVVLTFPSERAIFLREYSANMYSVSAYYFGRSSIETPFIIIFPTLMAGICYYIIGYNDYNAGKFFFFLLVSIFLTLGGNGAGLLIGSFLSDPKVGSNIVPMTVLPFMLFSGFYVNSSSLPVWVGWLQYISVNILSPFRYSLEAFMRNEYDSNLVDYDVVASYGFHFGMWPAFAMLAGISLILEVLALFALKSLVRKLE